MQTSANLNVMVKAARKAGRSLMKDFQEVENLQVSVKGAGDFVTKADIAAEKIIKDELLREIVSVRNIDIFDKLVAPYRGH